jgi:multimeric flavodoxin WrbA
MKIVVLNGSPKGNVSVTMQYVAYIQKKFPEHELKIIHIAQQINKIENIAQVFEDVMNDIRTSACVLWAFPLYVMHVHGNYKRFIELIHERNAQGVFRDKYAAALSTSIKFYDHTAHNYIRAICDDLEMRYVDFYSAEMRDLLKEAEQRRLVLFAGRLFDAIERSLPTLRQYAPLSWDAPPHQFHPGNHALDQGSKKVIIVTDASDAQTNLGGMIGRFQSAFLQPVEVVDISRLDIKGGCMGCLQCGYDYACAYKGKDAFMEMFNTKLKTADVLVFAGGLRDRYLSSRWKTFFDRSFFNTHTPSLAGRQWGWLISGPLRQNENLREILQGWAEIQQTNLTGIVTDEDRDSAALDGQIQQLAEHSLRCAHQGYVRPETFLRVGGMKIFRDEIWGHLRTVFQADHRYYKANGIYDFPQKKTKIRLLNALVALLFTIPAIRRRFYAKEIKPGMIRHLQRVVARA